MEDPYGPNLTKLGLLYEGNFDEWYKRISAILKVCGIDYPYAERYSKAADTITRGHVSPALLLRVPSKDLDNYTALGKHLKALATPFRFLDLPPELRHRIYDYAFKSSSKIIVSFVNKKALSYPSITRVSRKIRQEALSLFYSSANFVLHFDDSSPHFDVELEANLKAAKELQSWASKLVRAQLKHLRSVTLVLPSKARNPFDDISHIGFTYSAEKRHEITYPESFDNESKSLLDDHAKAVESSRQLLGLQGEAIILALVTNPGLWKWLKFNNVDREEDEEM